MDKVYIPNTIEQSIYSFWEKNNYFSPEKNSNKKSFYMVIPPPNITGGLHMGHAFQYTIIDILIRYNRMKGKNTLWQMGTDHAGIATQILVEKKLLKEKKIYNISHTKKYFLKKIWEWKEKKEKTIFKQIRRLGSSVDWNSNCFTLDPKISNAVNKAFIILYNNNLIYKGKRLSNWDSKLNSVISDLEVDMHNASINIWYIKYEIENNNKSEKINNQKKYITIATTRPETLLGDTAIAIHPDDSRYKNMIGKKVIVPIVNRSIPIIFDKYVDIKKGTGCVKVTPGHDFNDYSIGIRHKLPMINIFTFNLKIKKKLDIYDFNGIKSTEYNNCVPIFLQKLEKKEARNKILKILKKINLLENVKKIETMIPYGDRSNAIIEPILTSQWYVKTKKLAKKAIHVVKTKKILFFPKKYKKLYYSWMNNIQDWCISRQVIWGHRIPIWYDKEKNIYVGKNELTVRNKYNISDTVYLKQEKDVLDTWFSSSLWTFSTLGWPNKNNLVHIFHPSNILVSGFDIIFFWIARMIMLTLYLIKDTKKNSQIPFKKIYITGLIRDELGQKMSKSKGNVIDPIDMIDGISLPNLIKKRTKNMIKTDLVHDIVIRTKKSFPKGIKSYGTDALRLTFASLAAPTRNIIWDMNRLKSYRNFCNKIWNASRFIILYNQNKKISKKFIPKKLYFFDHWILIELNELIKKFKIEIDIFRFDNIVMLIFDFIKNKFCDWYLELVKLSTLIYSENKLQSTRDCMIYVLENILCLSHPIIPFITESIWEKVKNLKKITYHTIMLEKFPVYKKFFLDTKILQDMYWFKKIIKSLRNLRSQCNISYRKLITLYYKSNNNNIKKILSKRKKYFQKIAFIKKIILFDKNINNLHYSSNIIDNEIEIFILFDKCKNNYSSEELDIKIKKIQKKINCIELNLLNKNFLNKAPLIVIKKEKEKLILLKKNKKNLMLKNNI
ncbi:valine--tRNA ligase [Buchnera aphidicola (Kurisakia onigurumii)]|uniref:valine--tRNA ligase n=1 Tax=Buchnera aphidicola TaxID=9 RepID=UPI0031B71EAC